MVPHKEELREAAATVPGVDSRDRGALSVGEVRREVLHVAAVNKAHLAGLVAVAGEDLEPPELEVEVLPGVVVVVGAVTSESGANDSEVGTIMQPSFQLSCWC